MPNSRPPKRRWYQFSLRTLVVLLLVGGVFCGWRVHRAQKNRQRVAAIEKTVAEIEKRRGEVTSEWSAPQNLVHVL